VVFLPLYIDTNHNDVWGDAHFMYGTCPQLFRVYYFSRALSAMTWGAFERYEAVKSSEEDICQGTTLLKRLLKYFHL
jgi:hypothetical protein